MGLIIKDRIARNRLARSFERSPEYQSDSLGKICSGMSFPKQSSKNLYYIRTRILQVHVRNLTFEMGNIEYRLSLLHDVEVQFVEVHCILQRLEGLHSIIAKPESACKDLRYFVTEYCALYEKINEIATTISQAMVNQSDGEERNNENSYEGIATVFCEEIRRIDLTTQGLAIPSLFALLSEPEKEGMLLDVDEIFLCLDSDKIQTTFHEAQSNLANQRKLFGSIQIRFNHALDFNDVAKENKSAAKLGIADLNCANNGAKVVCSQVMMQAATSIAAQANFENSENLSLLFIGAQ